MALSVSYVCQKKNLGHFEARYEVEIRYENDLKNKDDLKKIIRPPHFWENYLNFFFDDLSPQQPQDNWY